MRPRDLCVGNTYEGKSGLRRRIVRWSVYGADASGYVGDIHYIPINRAGKEGKERVSYSQTFRNWAVREISISEVTQE